MVRVGNDDKRREFSVSSISGVLKGGGGGSNSTTITGTKEEEGIIDRSRDKNNDKNNNKNESYYYWNYFKSQYNYVSNATMDFSFFSLPSIVINSSSFKWMMSDNNDNNEKNNVKRNKITSFEGNSKWYQNYFYYFTFSNSTTESDSVRRANDENSCDTGSANIANKKKDGTKINDKNRRTESLLKQHTTFTSQRLLWTIGDRNPYSSTPTRGVGSWGGFGDDSNLFLRGTSSVRSILSLVEEASSFHDDDPKPHHQDMTTMINMRRTKKISDEKGGREEERGNTGNITPAVDNDGEHNLSSSLVPSESHLSGKSKDNNHRQMGGPGFKGEGRGGDVSDAETASRLAEGTLFALRDLTLDEAVELNTSLQFWTERWERPLLSWLEAGPFVWFSKAGYNHQLIGHKVSQIQSVLAKRCKSVGVLQQHIWRAGWQKGVSQWGVLGHGGGHWATVVGGDGALDETSSSQNSTYSEEVINGKGGGGGGDGDGEGDKNNLNLSESADQQKKSSSSSQSWSSELMNDDDEDENDDDDDNDDNENDIDDAKVDKDAGRCGTLWKMRNNSDTALAAWSVDAMKIVRDQLYRAGGGGGAAAVAEAGPGYQLPFHENWFKRQGKKSHQGGGRGRGSGADFVGNSADEYNYDDDDYLPIWATEDFEFMPSSESARNTNKSTPRSNPFVIISDLNLMAMEVSAILDYMESSSQMKDVRRKRLDQLKPTLRIIRDWYVIMSSVPILIFVGFKWRTRDDGWAMVQFCKQVSSNIASFYLEHVADPVGYVYEQLFTNRIRRDVTDQIARQNAIESLQIMLKSWLDEYYPQMPSTQRESIAERMDMTLIEKNKEDSINRHSLLEISDIVRMSLIEMQFIKKELMNAMSAMDDLMQSNEFNFKLAAMTPAVLIVYGASKLFRFLRYALLKVGKSKEQIYEALRLIVLDIERLLVMRDCPPSLSTTSPMYQQRREDRRINSAGNNSRGRRRRRTNNNNSNNSVSNNEVLKSDDLGMLMLLIHECRTVMWNNQRRFSKQDLRNMAEDLAELSGERGPVSVKQQLLIVSRMFRTYPFLKVVSGARFVDVKRF